MSSSITPPLPPPTGAGEPNPASPALDAAAAPMLWGDSDMPPAPIDPGTGSAPVGSEQALPTIGHIGRYALKYKMGVGGLGTVYAAYDPLLSRLIAVKTLNLEVDETERAAFNAVFINEARAAGGLSHPHIVTVFDAGISDKRAYIAMELLKGRDLKKLRQEGWRPTPAQAALIVRRVADALAFAHSKGVIHRDVKPANIFMVGRTQPRVLDFGIARVTHQHGSADLHSGAGSPYYMAPEQIRREPADRRADVFSLGVVLYELLTDTRPFRGETLKDIVSAVLTQDPPLASKLDPSVPKELALIVERAMAKDPEHRFRSARSFARELRQWLDDNPSTVESDTLGGRPALAGRRRYAIAAGVATAAIAVAAGLAWHFGGVGGLWPGERHVAQAPVGAAGMQAGLALPASGEASSLLATAPTTSAPAVAAASSPPNGSVAAISNAASATTTSPVSDGSPPFGAAAVVAMTTATEAAPVAASPLPGAITAPAPASGPVVPPALTQSTVVTGTATTGKAPADTTLPSGKTAATAVTLATGKLPLTATPPANTQPPPRETAKERRLRESGEREARERVMRAAAVAANLPVASSFGTVKIAISPWGEIEVDGNAAGAAPPLTELRLAEGRHQIIVRNGDFAPYVATVAVGAGQVVSLRYKFGS